MNWCANVSMWALPVESGRSIVSRFRCCYHVSVSFRFCFWKTTTFSCSGQGHPSRGRVTPSEGPIVFLLRSQKGRAFEKWFSCFFLCCLFVAFVNCRSIGTHWENALDIFALTNSGLLAIKRNCYARGIYWTLFFTVPRCVFCRFYLLDLVIEFFCVESSWCASLCKKRNVYLFRLNAKKLGEMSKETHRPLDRWLHVKIVILLWSVTFRLSFFGR